MFHGQLMMVWQALDGGSGAVAALCGLLRCWLSHRAAVRHDREVTRRLALVLSHPEGGKLAADLFGLRGAERPVPGDRP